MVTGCEDVKDKAADNSAEESKVVEVTVAEEPTLPERDRTADTDSEYVTDDEKILSPDDYSAINEYAAWFSRTFKINACVRITPDIGEKSPKEYADDYYKKKYGDSAGIMLLINNDTGEDIFLRKGTPSKFISDSDVEMLIAEISPLLVTENYRDAVNKAFELAELSLPEYAVDLTGKMTAEEITAANDILRASEENLSVVFLSSTGKKKISDFAKDRAEKYLDGDDDGALLFVNTQSGEYAVCAQGRFSGSEESQKELKTDITGCISIKDGKKSFDYSSAAEIFVNFALG